MPRFVAFLVLTACSHPQLIAPQLAFDSAAERRTALALWIQAEDQPHRDVALDRFLRACLANDEPSCVFLATGDSAQRWQISDDASMALTAGCVAGDPRKCHYSLTKPPRNAVTACAKGSARACLLVATADEEHPDRPLLSRACVLGDPDACELVKDSYPAAVGRANALFLERCNAGIGEDCIMLAQRTDGEENVRYRAQAMASLAENCLALDARACWIAVGFNDRVREREVLEMACTLDIASCRALAQFLIPIDLVAAARAYDRSCIVDVSYGYETKLADCHDAYRLTTDPVRRARLARRACELGDREDCVSARGARAR